MRTADVAIIGLDECFVSFDLVCAEFANDERTLCRKAISVKRNHTSNGFEVEWIDWFAGRMDAWNESAHSGRKDDSQIG
ncbi:MAG: hypothetical protein ACTS80_00415 [Candidatus Hodgkinia cicadicola]